MNKLLKKVFERPSTAEGMSVFEPVQCKDPLSFSWWIITHLASLYQFDRNGNVEEKVGLYFLYFNILFTPVISCRYLVVENGNWKMDQCCYANFSCLHYKVPLKVHDFKAYCLQSIP